MLDYHNPFFNFFVISNGTYWVLVDFGAVEDLAGVEYVVVVEAGIEMLPVAPNWANGFGLPVVTSGIKTILESCNPINAGLEKIESSNLRFLTLNNKVRKSCETEEVSPDAPVFVPPVAVASPDDVKLDWSEAGDFTKKT